MCAELKQHAQHWEAVVHQICICASTAHISGWFMLPHCGGLDGQMAAVGERGKSLAGGGGSFHLSPSRCQHRQSYNTAYITNTSARLPYGFVPPLPLSAHKRIKELHFYVRSQDNWKWWLNLWWPLCVENASLLILYAVVSYMALASNLSGTETFKSLSVWHTACALLSVDNTLFIKHL